MTPPAGSPLLDTKVVLVSGGTQGVGAGIARAAARAGGTVVVTGRRPELGTAMEQELRGLGCERAAFLKADVADVASAQQSVADTVERFGRVDCLVNAAGLTLRLTRLNRLTPPDAS